MKNWSMQRVLVLGCPGSGKSHFARRLAQITGLPLFYLDMLWHRPDKTTVAREDFDVKLDRILARTRWIIDGNYQRTLKRRLERCEAAFLFDLPLEACLKGVESRIGKKRPDMPWIENEFDPEFREWIINFRRDRLPGIIAMLTDACCEKIIFRSRSEARAWLRTLEEIDENGEEEHNHT